MIVRPLYHADVSDPSMGIPAPKQPKAGSAANNCRSHRILYTVNDLIASKPSYSSGEMQCRQRPTSVSLFPTLASDADGSDSTGDHPVESSGQRRPDWRHLDTSQELPGPD